MTQRNNSDESLTTSEAPPKPGATAAAALPSEDLLRGHNTVVIAHNGTAYRLQKTRAGKLILTK